MFKLIRITVLLVILFGVAMTTWRSQHTVVQWKYSLPVNIYPINGDGSATSAAYIRSLTREDFLPIETFMQEEATRYGRGKNASIEIRLGKTVDDIPPATPMARNTLNVVLWSLKMRWWAYRHGETQGKNTQVKLYVLYFDPAQTPQLAHSTALKDGLVGRVNVFASPIMATQNNVIIAHEFLHTLGATDKYDPATNQPLFPQGYAQPDASPRLPQHLAEIMGGRIPRTASDAEIPGSLDQTRIGYKTAEEINWSATP